MKVRSGGLSAAAVALLAVALVLEALPFGVAMVFAVGPTERIVETYSYFSLLPLGYANVAPMLTGIMTAVATLLGVVVLARPNSAFGYRRAALLCGIVALPFSVLPLFLFGTVSMTAVGYAVSGALLLSVCLLVAAGRRARTPTRPRWMR